MYGHPNADSLGRVAEHIKVMSDFLGRPVDTKKESVHHKNGIRDDNRIKNLELRTRWHGPGHRVSDAVKHAVETLQQYAPELKKEQSKNVVMPDICIFWLTGLKPSSTAHSEGLQ